jgi:hypothetical protein
MQVPEVLLFKSKCLGRSTSQGQTQGGVITARAQFGQSTLPWSVCPFASEESLECAGVWIGEPESAGLRASSCMVTEPSGPGEHKATCIALE